MIAAPEPPLAIFRHHGLLGTVIEVRVRAADDDSAELADRVVVDEVERLQQVFNARDPASELRRWGRGATDASPPLLAVLATAERWVQRSGGLFEPLVGRLVRFWAEAEVAGRVPSDDALACEVAAMADCRRRSDFGDIDLSAIAKGAIVDAACERGMSVLGVASLTINAGGDLRHVGAGSLAVGIEDPHNAFDNAAPLVVVGLGAGALATSGGARRGWRIEGRWFPHVIDPRDGRPVDRVASASVLAPDATTADVIATIATVASVEETLALVAAIDDVECLVVGRDRSQHRSTGWVAFERP